MQPIISCQLRTDLMERHRRAMVEYRAAVALMEALLGDAGFNEAFGAEAAQTRCRQIRNELTRF